MYKVRQSHGVLATEYGIWQEGANFVPPPNLPRELLRKWMEAGVIVTDESGPDVEEIMDEVDVLTTLNRKQLIALISANKDQLGTVKPRTSWSEDVIRQAIRDVASDLSSLKLPEEVAVAATHNPFQGHVTQQIQLPANAPLFQRMRQAPAIPPSAAEVVALDDVEASVQ